MANHPATVTMEGFGGLNNKLSPETMGEQFLEIATNIDIDAEGKLRLRKGYTQIVSGTSCHSLGSDGDRTLFYMDGDSLYSVDTITYNTILLQTGLDQNARMDYTEIAGRVYMSNGEVSYVYDRGTLRPWGINTPAGQPLMTVTDGQLTAGTYQVAITYRAEDGRTSGARLAPKITVGDNTGIHLFSFPSTTDSTVTSIDIYVSTPDGETLYYLDTVAIGTSSYDIVSLYGATRPLESQFHYPCPAGNLMQVFNGRIYIAKDNVLYYSNPHDYERYVPSTNYIQFEDTITNVMPVDGGIFVTADRLYYLNGNDAEGFRLEIREPLRAVANTAVNIVGSYVALENIPTGMKWLFTSNKGVIMVGSGGLTMNLTEANIMVDKADEGAALFRSQNGINQYISVLKDPSNNRLKMGDTAVATVVRNGITIS